MIVRATHDLRLAVLRVDPHPAVSPDTYVTIMTGTGLQKVKTQKIQPRDSVPTVSDLSFIIDSIPEWMKEALVEGQVLVIDREEFYSLPEEVIEHLEVLTY